MWSELYLVAVSCVGAPPASQPSTSVRSLTELMRSFESARGFEARFIERKQMKMLSKPLVTEGKLYFAGPDRLVRVVERPRPARVVVTPKAVVTIRGSHIDRLERPEVQALVGSLLSLFRGDLNGLRRVYELKYEVETRPSHHWQLELRPKSKRLQSLLRRLRFEGQGPTIVRTTVEDTSGDVTISDIHDARIDRVFSREELQALFDVP